MYEEDAIAVIISRHLGGQDLMLQVAPPTRSLTATALNCASDSCDSFGVGPQDGEKLTETILRHFRHLGGEAEAWRPIETCPRDGTKVLFYTPEDKEIGWLAFVAESFYDKHGELNSVHVPQWQDGLGPTHWMPLPATPQSISVAGE
jgi:hypothetical protein